MEIALYRLVNPDQGKNAMPIDPFNVFINARSFQIAANQINMLERKSVAMWPMVVNEAFSLELHLKCLLLVRNGRITRGHDVHDFFYQLSASDQGKIGEVAQERIEAHPEFSKAALDGIPLDMNSVLTRAKNLFRLGRYWHEGTIPDRDSSGYSGNMGIGEISDAIMLLLLEIHPDWKEKFETFYFPCAAPTDE